MAVFAKIAMEEWLCWLVLPALAYYFILQKLRRRRTAPLPPGPAPLPIIGNLTMVNQLTHRGLAALAQRYGGLLHLRLGRLHVFAVSTPEFAQEVLQAQDDAFSNRPLTIAVDFLTYGRADMAFAQYGPFWRQMRKTCVARLLSRRRAETWLAVRDEYAALVRAVAASGSGGRRAVNLGELIFSHTVGALFRAAFSVRGDEGRGEFIAVLDEFVAHFGELSAGDFFPWLAWIGGRGFVHRRLRAARGALDVYLEKVIEEHVARGRSPDDDDADMVDGLLAFFAEANSAGGKNGIPFTHENTKAMIMDVLFGAPETVRSTAEWALAELMHSPGELQRLQQELADVVGLDRTVNPSDLDSLPFLKCVVKEALRMHPPIPLLLHETARDCVVLGYSVPRGSRVLVNAWAIGRDGKAWKDADAFRPSRFMPGGEAAGLDFKGGCFELLPFGSGRRSCPAMNLGQHAVELVVAQLAHGFDWELPDGMEAAELDMTDVVGLTAPRAVRLSAIPTPRLTCPL